MNRGDSHPLEEYHSRVLSLTRRAQHVLPYGRSLSITLVAFITTIALLLFGLNLISLSVPTALPYWVHAAPYAIGAFAGYAGYRYSTLVEASDE